jgi:hypothetical protein
MVNIEEKLKERKSWLALIDCEENKTKRRGVTGRTWSWTCKIDEPALNFKTKHTVSSKSGANALKTASLRCQREFRNRFPDWNVEFDQSEVPRNKDPSKKYLEEFAKKMLGQYLSL